MTYPEFKARYALTPDPQQEAAILRAEGPTLLLAVPGSGKTTMTCALLMALKRPGPRGRSPSPCGRTRGS